jgi:hypothetical protein
MGYRISANSPKNGSSFLHWRMHYQKKRADVRPQLRRAWYFVEKMFPALFDLMLLEDP